jgi:TolB-like protein
MKRILAAVCVVAIWSTAARAEKMQIAVIDLAPRDVPKVVANAVTDIVRSEMVKTGYFTVIERAQMNEILKEQGLQGSGCTDQTCAVQVGKLLSARKILVGEVNRAGAGFVITVRIVDVEKGTAEFAATEKANSDDVIDQAGIGITRKLAQNIYEQNQDYFKVPITPAGYYPRGLVPGWGQFYAGNPIKGGVYIGSFILGLGLITYGAVNYNNVKKEYDDLQRGAPQSEFDKKYDAKISASRMFIGFLSFTAIVYAANWVDIIFFSKPDFAEKATVMNNAAGPYFAFDVLQDTGEQYGRKFCASVVYRY